MDTSRHGQVWEAVQGSSVQDDWDEKSPGTVFMPLIVAVGTPAMVAKGEVFWQQGRQSAAAPPRASSRPLR